MKHYKHIIISFFAIVVLGTPWLITRYPKSMEIVDGIFSFAHNSFANAFLKQGITVEELRDKYEVSTKKREDKVKIMIVPGHEPDFGGAEYRDLKEREVNVKLARSLVELFDSNPHYEVILARDEKDWNPVLKTYFNQNWDEISRFHQESKKQMERLLNKGDVSTYKNGVFHNDAPADVALRLYGINKWNNDNEVDLAIHIHFNDYPRGSRRSPGQYSGLAIYIPEKQFSNSTTTNVIADDIFDRLSKYNPKSDLPVENDGIIEEQELIAIGSYNTSNIPSMLIEYGYIYEPQFVNEKTRDSMIDDLAYSTYLGIEDFFNNEERELVSFDTPIFPYHWDSQITKSKADEMDVLALQTAMMNEGLYPPTGKTKNDCPRSGTFGSCTIKALTDFQNKYGIVGENGYVGEKTRSVLNSLYSVEPK
jgi:N-acetylmuramoyl-L-alanine amidase